MERVGIGKTLMVIDLSAPPTYHPHIPHPPPARLPSYKIVSDTHPNQYYWVTVDADADHPWACTCPNYVRHHTAMGYTCKHIRKVKAELLERMLVDFAQKEKRGS